MVEKELVRKAKYEEYDISQSVPGPFYIHTPCFSSTSPASNPDSSEKLLPKKPRRESWTPRSTGTIITIPTDIIKKIGPAADRLGSSNNQLVPTIATIINHCGEDIDDIALSKLTARWHRKESHASAAKKIKNDFECVEICQINFYAKLVPNLGVLIGLP